MAFDNHDDAEYDEYTNHNKNLIIIINYYYY